MNLKEFQEQYGISKLVRRHAEYRVAVSPAKVEDGGFGKHQTYALVYARSLDPAQLGLDITGTEMVIAQGAWMAEHNLIPDLFLTGQDQRNQDGLRLTREKICAVKGSTVKVGRASVNPALTYPFYTCPKQTCAIMDRFGDFHSHMYLSGHPEVAGVWTETAETFEARIVTAVEAEYPNAPFVFFDINWEAMVLLYYLHVEGVPRAEIPFGADAWIPTKGGFIVYSRDGSVVREVKPDFVVLPDFSGIND